MPWLFVCKLFALHYLSALGFSGLRSAGTTSVAGWEPRTPPDSVRLLSPSCGCFSKALAKAFEVRVPRSRRWGRTPRADGRPGWGTRLHHCCWFILLRLSSLGEPGAAPTPLSLAEHRGCGTVPGPCTRCFYGLGDDLQHHGGGTIPESCRWRRFIRRGRKGSVPTPSANRNMHVHARAITLCECDKRKLNVKSAVNSQ